MEESEKFLKLISKKNQVQKWHYSELGAKLRSVVTPFLYYFLHSAYQICTSLVYVLVYWYKLPVSQPGMQPQQSSAITENKAWYRVAARTS